MKERKTIKRLKIERQHSLFWFRNAKSVRPPIQLMQVICIVLFKSGTAVQWGCMCFELHVHVMMSHDSWDECWCCAEACTMTQVQQDICLLCGFMKPSDWNFTKRLHEGYESISQPRISQSSHERVCSVYSIYCFIKFINCFIYLQTDCGANKYKKCVQKQHFHIL